MDTFDETLKEWKKERQETKRRARGKGRKGEPQRMVQLGSDSSIRSVMSSIEGGNGR